MDRDIGARNRLPVPNRPQILLRLEIIFEKSSIPIVWIVVCKYGRPQTTFLADARERGAQRSRVHTRGMSGVAFFIAFGLKIGVDRGTSGTFLAN